MDSTTSNIDSSKPSSENLQKMVLVRLQDDNRRIISDLGDLYNKLTMLPKRVKTKRGKNE